MSTTGPPTPYGRRLIAQIIDERAQNSPNSHVFSLPRSADPKDGFRDIGYGQFASAINQAAWWIEKTLGKTENFDTLAYMGPSDLRYAILIIACQKTGYKAFLPSPRNSLEAHLSLLEQTDCKLLLMPKEALPGVKDILFKRTMQVHEIPGLDDWLNTDPVPLYRFEKKFEDARLEPFVVLHTSGSTGLPKAIVVAQGAVSASDAFLEMPSLGQPPTFMETWKDSRVFLGMPLYHAAGLLALFAIAVPCKTTVVLGPDVPMTAELADAIHVHGNVHANLLAPSLLEEIARSPSYCENVSKLRWVAYAGGPLSKDAGDLLSKKAPIHTVLGSTETALLPVELSDGEEWQYLKFSPCMGGEFRPYENDLHELVIVRDPKYEHAQGIFATFPDLQEYSMKDLYSRHPSKPDLWAYHGRTDDIIIFSNAEKLNPVTMEGLIGSHPEVLSALIVGQGYFQSALLVEPRQHPISEEAKAKLLESIWPLVARANQGCPDYAVISKDLVFFTPPGRPFVRTAKGTVLRSATVTAFKKEIDEMYGISVNQPNEDITAKVSGVNMAADLASLQPFLHRILSEELGTNDFDDDTEFSTIGLDSLHVMNMVRKVNAALDKSNKVHIRVTQHVVYYNHTVNKLAAAVMAILEQDQGVKVQGVPAGSQDRIQAMQALLAASTSELPVSARAPMQAPSGKKTVILTGSTGSLGSYLLDRLLADPSVTKVYCFERVHHEGASDLERQVRAMKDHGLDTDVSNDRVSFLDIDLALPYFGLTRSTYVALLRTVTHILHDAWEVNFELPLESFIPTHIHGVRQFIDFSSHSTFGAFLFFVSSVSSVMNWPLAHEGPVPEQVIEDWSVSSPMGYAESKLVSERILANASCLAGVPTATVRVGQIAGPTTKAGSWHKTEWFPSLIASSKFMGMVPETLGAMDRVDWIPVDVLAQIIVELLWSTSGSSKQTDQSGPADGGSSKLQNLSRQLNDLSMQLHHHLNQQQTMANGDSTNGSVSATDVSANSTSAESSTSGVVSVILHTTNPRFTSYGTLLPAILSHLPPNTKTVPFAEWVSALSASSEDPKQQDPEHNPAVKLLDFYESMVQMEKEGKKMVVLDTKKTEEMSKTMGGLEAINQGWMDTWMGQWGFEKV